MSPRTPDVRVDRQGQAYVRDGACGRCAHCVDGLAAWCERWSTAGRAWQPLGPARADPEIVTTVLACLDLVRTADAWRSAVAVLGVPPRAADLLAACGIPRAMAVSADRAGITWVRTVLAGHGTERADLIVSVDGRLDLAAKWVRRGGQIASQAAIAVMPAIDTLVMREVEVLTIRDAAAGVAPLRRALVRR